MKRKSYLFYEPYFSQDRDYIAHKNFYVGIIPSVSDISMNNLHDQYFLTLHDVY